MIKFPKQKKQIRVSKKIDNYRELFFYISVLWNCMCPIALEKGQWANTESLHHRLHNTKINRKRFPLFIDSVFNLVPVNNKYHMENPNWGKFKVYEAEKIENYIINNRDCLQIGYFRRKIEILKIIEDILNEV